jgi:hypothetical protein
MITLAAPALAKLRAMAKPMPPELLVMRRTFPLRDSLGHNGDMPAYGARCVVVVKLELSANILTA